MYTDEIDDNIELYEIYFNQIKSKKDRLEFINNIFSLGYEPAVDSYMTKHIPELNLKIIYSGESFHPRHGPAYLCVDQTNIMHISTNKLLLAKGILKSFDMAGYIITKIPKPIVQIKHPECRFYRAYKLHNTINNIIPISLS